MTPSGSTSSSGRLILLNLAALVVVVAGLKTAAPLLVPFICSIVLAVLAAPPVFWLHRRKLPLWLAILLVILALVVVEVGVGVLIGSQFNDFIDALPGYQDQLTQKFSGLLQELGEQGIDTSRLSLAKLFDPGKAMKLTASLFTGLTGLLGNTVLILFTVVFLLLETAGLPAKLQASGREVPLEEFARFTHGLNRYLVIKAGTSLATGVLVGLLLMLLEVPYPILWGVLTFFLNFVPNIGSVIAAVPPVLLALVTGGVGTGLLLIGGALLINMVIGNIIEPRFMGRGLGLSTLVVFLSLVFWGWIFGAVGLLLSVPLTMALKIGCEISPATRWVSILLGPEIDAARGADGEDSP